MIGSGTAGSCSGTGKNGELLVYVATIAGAPEPFEVELRTPPAGSTPIPALRHSCIANGAMGIDAADPGVRLAEATRLFRRHTVAGDVCVLDYRAFMTEVARQIRLMTGDTCIGQAVSADCIAYDVVGEVETALPACTEAVTTNCFSIASDGDCPARLDVVRSSAPAPETVVSVRCR